MEKTPELPYDEEQQLNKIGLERLFVLLVDFETLKAGNGSLNTHLVETGVELFKRRNLGCSCRLMMVITSAQRESDCLEALKPYGLEPEVLKVIDQMNTGQDAVEDIASCVSAWVKSVPGAIALPHRLPYQPYWSGVALQTEIESGISDFYKGDAFSTLTRICASVDEQTPHEYELHSLALAQLLVAIEATIVNDSYDFYDSAMLENLDNFQLAAESPPEGWYQGIEKDELDALKKETLLSILDLRRGEVVEKLNDFFGGAWGLLYGLYRFMYPNFSQNINTDFVDLNRQSAEDAENGYPEMLLAFQILNDGWWDFEDE